MIDSHVHIDSNVYREVEHLDDIIGGAREAGVDRMVTPALHLDSFQDLKELQKRYPATIFPAVGIHPHEASPERCLHLRESLTDSLSEMATPIVGETGLEGHYDFVPMEVQLESLRHHLDVARVHGCPIILHCRQTEQLLYDELKKADLKHAGVVHCFTGDWEWAQRFLELGFFVGLTGIVTFKKAEQVHEVARRVPADRLLVETDGPYLAPIPHRGKTNKPEYIPLIVDRIAHLRGESFEKIAQDTVHNTEKVFRLPELNPAS